LRPDADGVAGFRPPDAILAAVFICAECLNQFSSAADLRQHLLLCINPKRQPRVRLQRLTAEQLHAHKVSSEQIEKFLKILMLKCPVCEMQFEESLSFKLHMEVHKLLATVKCKQNELSKSLTPQGTFTCNFLGCPFTSTTRPRMYNHGRNKHKKSKMSLKCEFSGSMRLVSEENEQLQLEFKCLFGGCGRRLSSLSELKRHSQTHEEKEILKAGMLRCDVAGCTFVGRYLRDHTRNVHENPGFKCQICGIYRKDLSNFRRHLKQHKTATAAVIKCAGVNCEHWKCSSLNELNKHKGSNVKVKASQNKSKVSCSWTCSVCGKLFPTRQNLRDHINEELLIKSGAHCL
jgi:C2H2-type zinc finger